LPIQANFTGSYLEISGQSFARDAMFGPKTLICLEQANGTKPAVLVVTAL
jgi:hypothetical protein